MNYRGTDEQRTRKNPESSCDSVNRHGFQNSYQAQMHSRPQAPQWMVVRIQNLKKTGFGGRPFRQWVAYIQISESNLSRTPD